MKLWILALLATLSRMGCGGSPGGPSTPQPTPSPQARPLATALENLSLIRGLEQASGRPTILIVVGGATGQDGRVPADTAMHYIFADMRGTVPKLYSWRVGGDGSIEFRDEVIPLARYEYTELVPHLRIDTDEGARLARESGIQPFIDRYPRAFIQVNCRFLAGLPVWHLQFFATDPRPSPFCEPSVWLNAETGKLLAHDLSCISRLP